MITVTWFESGRLLTNTFQDGEQLAAAKNIWRIQQDERLDLIFVVGDSADTTASFKTWAASLSPVKVTW